MRVIESYQTVYNHSLDMKTCFLDIETTGLLPSKDYVFCIGMSYYVNDMQLKTIQLFAEKADEEQMILEKFLQVITGFTKIYTYNGIRFEIPFLTERLAQYDLDWPQNRNVFDLKKIELLKNISKSSRIKREELEKNINFSRTIQTKGKELIKLYSLYTQTNTPSYLDILLKHNQEELISIYYLYIIYLVFLNLNTDKIIDSTITNNKIGLELKAHLKFESHFQFDITPIIITCNEDKVFIDFNIGFKTLKNYLTPAKDYVYIDSQNQLIHKSLTRFIPKELTRKVSAKECYLSVEDYFIEIPSSIQISSEKIFYDLEERPYILYKDTLESNMLWKIIKNQLKPLYK